MNRRRSRVVLWGTRSDRDLQLGSLEDRRRMELLYPRLPYARFHEFDVAFAEARARTAIGIGEQMAASLSLIERAVSADFNKLAANLKRLAKEKGPR